MEAGAKRSAERQKAHELADEPGIVRDAGDFGPIICAQSQKTLTNADIVEMTKEGFDSNLIVQEIQANDVDFDISPQALINLKNAGVTQSVMQAMLLAQTAKPSPSVVPAHATVSPPRMVLRQIQQNRCATRIPDACCAMARKSP